MKTGISKDEFITKSAGLEKGTRERSVLESSRLRENERIRNSSQSDEELLEEYRIDGNEGAVAELYRRYKQKMLGYIYVIIRDNDEAKDVLHNAWEIVLNGIKKKEYEQVEHFEKWFKTICYREARQWNIERMRFLHGKFMPEKEDTSLDALQKVANHETELLLQDKLSMLTKAEAKIVRLYALEDRSNREIAKKLRISETTVRVIYRNALLKLKKCVDNEL